MTTTNPRFNYSGHGWEGGRYDDSLSLKDIAKKIRDELKVKYPDCVFSVMKKSYSGGGIININLMAASFDVLAEPNEEVAATLRGYGTVEEKMGWWRDNVESGNYQLNHYYLKDDYRLTEKAREVLADVVKIANSYNFDDSDGMIDYFHTNFYLHFSVGKWDKKFEKIN